MPGIGKLPQVRLYYDGDCPFCSRFARYVELKRAGDIEMIDARTAPSEMARFHDAGFDINEGLLLAVGDTTLQGADALEWLDGRLAVSGLPDRIRRLLLGHPKLMRRLYPALNRMRRFLLALLGRNSNIE